MYSFCKLCNYYVLLFSLTLVHNSRETARNATLIITMNGNSTEIKNPEDMSSEPKRFAFDHSYWSHSEYSERPDGYLEATGSKYADQVLLIIYMYVQSTL